MIEPSVYREMGLNDSEYQKILDTLGREPTITELGMYAVMWSEHCGYKYSRPVLRLFKKYKEAMDTGAVENAGVVDIGDGLGIVMKMESHNHPSAVEPFQGAATGVGGILRDIFTMGARPIANLNSLRFGTLDDARTRYLFEHVVEGIAHYGNCVGVPTVGGEIYFHPCYQGNPLVNAMAVGIVEIDKIASAAAKGIGNPVIYVGSSTGRDGIHGATFASVELGPDSESKRPNVQIGDPFQEKLLIEATLEALATGRVVGIQDMGAAGLTCSTTETAAKAGTGMEIDVRLVPQREAGMTPYEIMLSESQERMLAIAEKGHEDEVVAVFKKWGLSAAVIGHVTDTGRVVVKDNGDVVADVPAKSLTDECPTYYLETHEPAYIREVQSADLSNLPEPKDCNEVLLKLLASPSIASKRWVYQQYDQMVQTQTMLFPGRADAAVLKIRGTKKAIALTTDCNPRYCYLDPYVGAQIAVAEAARNLACVGAKPLAVTDCLNFANPEKPDNFWQFRRAVEGLADACEALGTPVISGNVSFYNETPEHAIYPTPTVGMVGLIEDASKVTGVGFKNEEDRIFLIAATKPTLAGSEYLSAIHGLDAGAPPTIDLKAEALVQEYICGVIEQGLVVSAHDISDGGFAVALAECCIAGGMGANVDIFHSDKPDSLGLFGEMTAGVIFTISDDAPGNLPELTPAQQAAGIHVWVIGEVYKERLQIRDETLKGLVIDLSVEELSEAYEGAIPKALGALADVEAVV
ncbi:MAG TPA: phosphoribosylformylglycinamidine synthase subunit PurL [Capsulimonadaceae bacterium]|nr:phosphoribosylformylglycinamidine synthase subunit PurL [Capsulimonadaceae bacterium]